MSKTLGEMIRDAREAMGISQSEAVKMIKARYGVSLSASYLSMIETGERQNLSTKLLTALADFFGLEGIPKYIPKSSEVDVVALIENKNIQLVASGRPLTQQQRLAILRALDQDKLPAAAAAQVPIVGTIRAGVPILTEGHIVGYLDIPANIKADFAVEIRGDSMIWAGVHEGDYAICRQAEFAHTGQMVVAAVQDVDWGGTIKYYVQANGNKILRAANPDYKDIPLGPEDRIVGVVVALLKDPPGMHIYEDLVSAITARGAEWASLAQTAANYGLRPREIEKLVELFAHVVKQVK